MDADVVTACQSELSAYQDCEDARERHCELHRRNKTKDSRVVLQHPRLAYERRGLLFHPPDPERGCSPCTRSTLQYRTEHTHTSPPQH
jgi:hypothetical protein